MPVRIERVMSLAEHDAMAQEAVGRGWYRNDKRMFLPGMAWFEPYLYDPLGEFAAFRAADPERAKTLRLEPMIKTPPSNPDDSFLSPHYWRDWASKRAPICVVCPNGETWQIDRRSSNGNGWTVTGELPRITCAPSIVAGNYHGFLRDGEFTADLEGRLYIL